MPKKRPVIITCAVTGAIHTPSMSPHLPITPQEIADAAIGAAEAGASIVHLHARDPHDGRPSQDVDLFRQFLPQIKAKSDVVINITTGGAPTMGVEERLQPVAQLKPELASLNMGSMNFGLYEMLDRYSEFKHDWERPYLADSDDRIFRNTFRDIAHILNTCAENRTRFEIECYDIGHLYTAAHFLQRGLLKAPIFIQSVFGLRGGIGGILKTWRICAVRLIACLAMPISGRSWGPVAIRFRWAPWACRWAAMCGSVWRIRCGMDRANWRRPMPIRSSVSAQ